MDCPGSLVLVKGAGEVTTVNRTAIHMDLYLRGRSAAGEYSIMIRQCSLEDKGVGIWTTPCSGTTKGTS